MNAQEHIERLRKYLAKKVLAGDYEFIECNTHIAKIKVDGNVEIQLWIANIPEHNLDIYSNTFSEVNSFFWNKILFV